MRGRVNRWRAETVAQAFRGRVKRNTQITASLYIFKVRMTILLRNIHMSFYPHVSLTRYESAYERSISSASNPPTVIHTALRQSQPKSLEKVLLALTRNRGAYTTAQMVAVYEIILFEVLACDTSLAGSVSALKD